MNITAVADVNWLLGSLAQSSAALIAIVGGLLVSRYVALHAEQDAAERRIADLSRRELEAVAQSEDAKRRLERNAVNEFLDDRKVFEFIVDSRFSPEPEELVNACDGNREDLPWPLFLERLGDLTEDLRTALREMAPLVPEGKAHPSWSTFTGSSQMRV